MKSIAILALAFAGVSAGCTFGKSAASLPTAVRPAGANVKVTTVSGSAYSGELLEVRNDGMTVLETQGKIMFVPFTTLGSFKVEGLGSDYASNSTPLPAMLGRLQAVSHYPQGISPELQQRLIAHAQQSEIMIAR